MRFKLAECTRPVLPPDIITPASHIAMIEMLVVEKTKD
jgi:hypothetical protein